jgi:hypothetical protein
METNDELAALLANKLAEMDNMDEDALFSLRWSGGTAPEPMGDAWNMDYLPKGEQLAAVVEQQVRTLRLAQPCDRFSREQIMDAMIEAEVSDGAFKTMLLKMDKLEAQARQTLASRERPNVGIELPRSGRLE